jgi:AraC family transcriptional regulator
VRAEFPQFIVRDATYRSHLHLPRHAHGYSNVSVVAGGEIDEIAGGREHRGRAFSVVFKPAGCEHENRVGGRGARTLTIELRGAVADQPWGWFEEPEVVRAAVALVRARAPREIESRAFELLAEVFAARRATSSAPAWLGEVTRILESRFDEPLRFESIAREVGLHPVYLSRAFQRHTGRTMQQTVRALRLQRARDLLSTSRRSMTFVAADCGFTDSSHLCRTFADLVGVTPSLYRRLCGQM